MELVKLTLMYIMFFSGVIIGFYLLCSTLGKENNKKEQSQKKAEQNQKEKARKVMKVRKKMKKIKSKKSVEIKAPNGVSQIEYGSGDADSKREAMLNQRKKEDESYNLM